MKHLPTLALAALLGAASTPLAAQSLDERVGRLEQRLNSSVLIDMAQEMQRLRQEVQTLRGDKEVLERELEELRAQQRALYDDVDGRLRTLESATPAQAPGSDQPALRLGQPQDEEASADESATGTEARDASAPLDTSLRNTAASDPEQAYRAAYRLLVDGRHAEAGEAFAAFIEAQPEHQLTPNAYYWLGESWYVVREFAKALPQFQAVPAQFPDSNKTPDAMLKIAYIHYEQGEQAKSRQQLESLIARFPDSAAAALGRQRLERMR
ncbi:tol-pal system protein YbgF [Alkalilimnicola sp. S0819]|uniref:tol-pal system protein YbgF n=1 Tax=Alkalilimnicola sp. S0819 TaxID=2613922 RepID=UPI001261AEB1|nr:tol-pal system protein YbgF [Alkalilimnicola sp. S0819]KAB7628280.1 tol-pal system protein YbgF [Alkalilimnicola sp. S0819]MPQ15176.1 tol-pal system protein YbgF [Alkalilimnicola sp. S0819]